MLADYYWTHKRDVPRTYRRKSSTVTFEVKYVKKVKHSRYRPGQAQRVPVS